MRRQLFSSLMLPFVPGTLVFANGMGRLAEQGLSSSFAFLVRFSHVYVDV